MPAKAPKKQIQYPLEDRIYYGVVNLVLSLFTLVILLPLINIVAASFSSPTAVGEEKDAATMLMRGSKITSVNRDRTRFTTP